MTQKRLYEYPCEEHPPSQRRAMSCPETASTAPIPIFCLSMNGTPFFYVLHNVLFKQVSLIGGLFVWSCCSNLKCFITPCFAQDEATVTSVGPFYPELLLKVEAPVFLSGGF